MTKAKKKAMSAVAMLITALMVLTLVANTAQAAPKWVKGDFSNPAQGVRMGNKYSGGLDVTSDSSVEVISGKNRRVANGDVDDIFTNFDYDYNAGYVRYPNAKDGFHKGSDRVFTGDYDDLVGHIKASENTRRGFEKWNMFNLKNAGQNEIKIKVSNLNYFNADDSTGRMGTYDKVNAIITFNSWDKTPVDSKPISALVENFSFDNNIPNFDYDKAVSRLNSSRCKSHWSKSGSKYTYDRPDKDPYLIVSITNGGLPGIRIARLENIKYTVDFEYAEDTADEKHKKGSKATLSTNVSAKDIDVNQCVEMTPGGTSHVEAYAIPENSSFTYGNHDVLSGDKFTFQDYRPAANRTDDPRDAFAIYTDTDSYSMRYTSGDFGAGGYSYFAQNSAPSVFYVHNAPYKTVGDHDEDGEVTHDRKITTRTNVGIEDSDSETVKTKKVRSLSKSDIVNKKGTAKLKDMTVSNFDGTITFKIRHKVTNDLSLQTMFTKYQFIDDIDPIFEIIDSGMQGPGVTKDENMFKKVTDPDKPQRVSYELKELYSKTGNQAAAGLKAIAGNEHVMYVKVKLRDNIKRQDFENYINNETVGGRTGDGKFIIVPNSGKIAITDSGPTWTSDQTEVNNNQFVQSTDTTFTAYSLPGNESPQKVVADNDEKEDVTTGGEPDPTNDNKVRKERPDDFDYAAAKAQTSSDIARPLKDLQDTNSLNKRGTTVTYKIRHKVNSGFGDVISFSNYVVTDNVDPAWQIKEAYMDEDVAEKSDDDITLKPESQRAFEQIIDSGNPNKIQFKAKAAALADPEFYGRNHVLVLKVQLRPLSEYDYSGYLNNKGNVIIVPNKAHLKVTSPQLGTLTDEDTDEMYTTYQVPKPEKRPVNKFVSDTDNRKNIDQTGSEGYDILKASGKPDDNANPKDNTLEKHGNKYTYHITNTISDKYIPYWYFDSYTLTDTVPDIVKIDRNSVKVFQVSWDPKKNIPSGQNYVDKTDVTNTLFGTPDFSNNDRTISISAKEDELKKADFYDYKRYILEFDVQIDADKHKEWSTLKQWADPAYKNRILTWENKATLNITDKDDPTFSSAENPANPTDDDKKQAAGTWTAETDIVKTHIALPKPKKNAPVKTVSDSNGKTLTGEGDEIRVNENTLREPTNIYTYHVRQKLGGGGTSVWTDGAYSPCWKFKSFVIEDTFKDSNNKDTAPIKIIEEDNAEKKAFKPRVYQYAWSKDGNPGPNPGVSEIRGGVDVTDATKLFDVKVTDGGKKVTATMKPEAFNGAADDLSNYNVMLYELRFDCEIDTKNYDSEESLAKWATANTYGTDNVRLRWPNKANVKITDEVDPRDPDSEDGKAEWSKDTNTVHTNVWIGTNEEGDKPKPGLILTKTAEPYEFQVGDDIPYTITIEQKNPNAVGYNVVAKDTDFPKGFSIKDNGMDGKAFKVELSGTNGKREGDFTYSIQKIKADKGDGFEFNTKYLYPGEKITIKFIGNADKTINGKVVPNTVVGRLWGSHDPAKEDTWDKASTSVYINSPKLDITKTASSDKTPDSDGKVRYKNGDTIHFTSVIRNVNPGTFMRNIYALDVVETKGLTIKPGTVRVSVKEPNGTMSDLNDLLGEKAYKVESIHKDEDGHYISLKNLDNRLGSKSFDNNIDKNIYDIETSGEKADNEGDQLPKDCNGGFVVKFLGKYRNLGYMDPKTSRKNPSEEVSIPATSDNVFDKVRSKVGKNATYMPEEMRKVEAEQVKYGSSAYTKDYENLNLQGYIEIDYDCEVSDGGLTELANFIKAPATENTNNKMIHNDDSIPSGGDFANSKEDVSPEDPDVEHTKSVQEKSYKAGDTLHYETISELKNDTVVKNVVLKDRITTKNAVYKGEGYQKSFKLFLIKGNHEQPIVLNDNAFVFAEDNMSVTVNTGIDLKLGQKIKMTYEAVAGTPSAEDDKDGIIHNISTFSADNVPDIEAECDVPPNPPGEKTALAESTYGGAKLPYTLTITNNDPKKTLGKIKMFDHITSENALYNDDFTAHIGDKKVTDFNVTKKGKYSIEIIFGDNVKLKPGETIKASYSATAEGDETVVNVYHGQLDDRDTEEDIEEVPGISHKKDVKEYEHDGPDGERNVLHYTLTSRNNDNEKEIKNVVITDTVLSENLVYNDDIKVLKDGTDITGESGITIAEDKMSFEIKLKDPLAPGETIVTTYSGNVKDRNQVDNETVLKADGIDGIKDDEHVPGPGDGDVLTVYKSCDPPTDTEVKPGQTITYILKAVNTGKDTVKFGHIRDYIPEGTTYHSVQNGGAFVKDKNYCEWVLKDIKPGEKNAQTVTFKVKVNTENVPKEIFNHALFEKHDKDPGKPGDPNMPDPKLKTRYVRHYTTPPTDEEKKPLLVGKKSCEPESGTLVKVGDTIKYFVEVENTGKKDTSAAGIRDYVPEGTQFVNAEDGGRFDKEKNCVDWTNLTIKTGEKIKVAFTVKVTNEAEKLMIVRNQALYQDEWTDPEKDPSSSTNIVEHPLEPGKTDLSGKKSSDPVSGTLVNVGDIIKYFIEVENKGDKDSHDAGIRDYIPEGTEFAKAENGGEFNKEKNCVDWSGLTIKAGEKVKVAFTVKVTEKAKELGKVVNVALYQDDWSNKDEDPSEKTNEVEHPLKPIDERIRGKQVTLYKSCDPPNNSLVKTGDIITYKLTAKNTGAATSKYTHIRDYIPEGTTFHSVQNKGAFVKSGNYVEWVVKGIKVGKSKIVTFKVKVNENPPKIIRNYALHETFPKSPGKPGKIKKDPRLESNPVQHKTDKYILTDPVIEVIKGSIPKPGTPVKKGDSITYTLKVMNTGESAAKSIVVRDVIPKGTKYISGSANAGGKYAKSLKRLQWVISSLDAGKNKVLKFKVKVTAKKFNLIQNQAKYDRDFDPKDPKDPKNWSNIVEHPPIPFTHTKTAKQKSTHRGGKINYMLTTKILGPVKQVVITDRIDSRNFKYNEKSLKVLFNGSDVTKKVKTAFKTYSFTVKTGMNAKKGDVFKVRYSGTNMNGKKVLNTSAASAKGIKPVIAKHKIPAKPKNPIVHKKSATEKATAKGRTIHYTLSTNIRAKVKKVVITDKVKSQNFKYNRKSLKIFFNGKNVTKEMKDISFDKYSFVIKTGMDAKKGDKFKVTYSGKTTNDQKVVNESSAYAKGIKPVIAKENVPQDKAVPSKNIRGGRAAKTGDDFRLPLMIGLFALAGAVTILTFMRRKNGK